MEDCIDFLESFRKMTFFGGAQSEYITGVLGRPAQPLAAMPAQAVIIAREQQTIGADDSLSEFDVVLTSPMVSS